MTRFSLVPMALLVAGSGFAACQQNGASQASPGLELLQRVVQHYADAKTYSISAINEITQTSEYQRHWSKIIITAAEAPGGRYHFEGRAGTGNALRVSDGKTVWTYRVDENHYTAQPAAVAEANASGPVAMAEVVLPNAKFLKAELTGLTRTLRSASLDPEEPITVDGKPIRCVVVHVRTADLNRVNPNAEFDKKIWIDKQQQTIVKIETRQDIKRGPTTRAMQEVGTTTYTNTVLDGPLPDSMFTFVPPAGAKLMEKFPDPMDGYGMPTMAGNPVPQLKLKSADGKVVSMDSFRGKPVLIDFWATWCAPCIAQMPRLAELYKQGKEKGLVLLSIDQDEDAAKATEFLAKHNYDWPNFHDGDGEVAKLMGSSALPRTVLVDAKGQIVYDAMGADENRIRKQIAELSPEFANLAPKPQQPAPCVASK